MSAQFIEHAIAGVVEVRPRIHRDERGWFAEMLKVSELCEAGVEMFPAAQANISESTYNTVRGIHFADNPPGQAKYVTCMSGVVADVIVDIRPDSPTYRTVVVLELNADAANSVYIPAGLGHAFWVRSEHARVSYLCSSEYDPEREHSLNPLDPDLDLPWHGMSDLIISQRDQQAPTLATWPTQLPRLG